MALSKDSLLRLNHAVTSESVGDEIAARLILATPATEAAASSALSLLDRGLNSSVLERLTIALAGDSIGANGSEIAGKINGAANVLKAMSDGVGSVAEVSRIVADTRTNTADGEYFDIDARSGNQYRVYMDTTGGDSTQPAAGGRTLTRVDISGGADTAANVADLVAGVLNGLSDFSCPTTGTGTVDATDANKGVVANIADGNLSAGSIWAFSTQTQGVNAPAIATEQAAMGSAHLSASAKFSLIHALADEAAANDFESHYNAMVDAINGIS